MAEENRPAPRPSDANRITRQYLDSILIEERLIDAVLPSIDVELFARKFDTPIMMPALSHLKRFIPERPNGMVEYALAAKQLGCLNWVGMCENDEFAEIMETGAATVRIIKPYAEEGKIADQIACAEKTGAVAVGIDIDHIFGYDGKYDDVFGHLMTTQTREDIAGYVKSTPLPFVIKGVLSVSDAVKSAEAGVAAILVSHHHGRLPFAVPPLMVLPSILEAVKGSGMKVFVDCGINSGADAYKALALGADAAAVGRVIMSPLTKDGAQGVVDYIRRMNEQLITIMGYTGCASLAQLDASALWIDGRPCK